MPNKARTLLSMVKSAVEVLPDNESFLLDLKSTVAMLNPDREPSQAFKPSSMNCLRLCYFDMVKAPRDISIAEYSGVRIPETGSASHESIQKYVSKMQECGKDCVWIKPSDWIKQNKLDYLEIKDEGEFETLLYDTRYNIRFKCDGIIKYKGTYYILEIKTETERKNAYRENADDGHRNQSICYSLALNINKIMWLYESRDLCVPKTFITTVTEEEKGEMVTKFEIVNQAVKDSIPPERTENRKACQYCHYINECKKYK